MCRQASCPKKNGRSKETTCEAFSQGIDIKTEIHKMILINIELIG